MAGVETGCVAAWHVRFGVDAERLWFTFVLCIVRNRDVAGQLHSSSPEPRP